MTGLEEPHVAPRPAEPPETKRWWHSWFVGEMRSERLGAALERDRRLFAIREARASQDHAAFLDDARRLLDAGKRALLDGQLNEAWAFVLDAERVAVAADTHEELRVKTEALREEIGHKVKGGRQPAAMRVLGRPGDDASLAAVQEALLIRDEDSQNRYYRLDLLAGQVARLGVLLVATVGGILVAAALGLPPLGQFREMLGWAALLGATGGLLGAMRSVTEGARQKIPEQLAGWPTTAVRPLLGAAAGIGAALLVKSGVAAIAISEVDLAPLASAFVAGFSERYFLSIVPGGGDK